MQTVAVQMISFDLNFLLILSNLISDLTKLVELESDTHEKVLGGTGCIRI